MEYTDGMNAYMEYIHRINAWNQYMETYIEYIPSIHAQNTYTEYIKYTECIQA